MFSHVPSRSQLLRQRGRPEGLVLLQRVHRQGLQVFPVSLRSFYWFTASVELWSDDSADRSSRSLRNGCVSAASDDVTSPRSQKGQEDGADAAGVGGGGHRGSDHAPRSPAGPQPAPPGLLLQVHHLTPSLLGGSSGGFAFLLSFFFLPVPDEPIRLRGLGLARGGN